MLVTADPSLKTNRDLRQRCDGIAGYVREFAMVLRENDDRIAEQMLDALGMSISSILIRVARLQGSDVR